MLFPRWIVYHSFYADIKNRKFVIPYLFVNYFDLHPRRFINFLIVEVISRFQNQDIYVFLHIPKTGGSYIQSIMKDVPFVTLSHALIRKDFSDNWIPIGLTGTRYKNKENHFLFSTVRHPLTLLRSYYHHVVGFSQYDNPYHYDYENAKRGFKYLIKAIMDREDKWPSRKFLFPHLFDQDGKLLVSWINRQENLDEDMNRLSEMRGFNFIPGKPKRVAPTKPLDKYYDQDLYLEIIEHYSREIKLFGYKENGQCDKWSFQDLLKKQPRYNYIADKLVVSNESDSLEV